MTHYTYSGIQYMGHDALHLQRYTVYGSWRITPIAVYSIWVMMHYTYSGIQYMGHDASYQQRYTEYGSWWISLWCNIVSLHQSRVLWRRRFVSTASLRLVSCTQLPTYMGGNRTGPSFSVLAWSSICSWQPMSLLNSVLSVNFINKTLRNRFIYPVH